MYDPSFLLGLVLILLRKGEALELEFESSVRVIRASQRHYLSSLVWIRIQNLTIITKLFRQLTSEVWIFSETPSKEYELPKL